jgi:hypothetical protein
VTAPVAPGGHEKRLRSWGETSEVSAHIIALLPVSATGIPAYWDRSGE